MMTPNKDVLVSSSLDRKLQAKAASSGPLPMRRCSGTSLHIR